MYKYYNPHPKGLSTDDCVKRAIVVVTGKDYSRIQRELNEYKAVTGAKSFNSIKNLRYVEDVLKAKLNLLGEQSLKTMVLGKAENNLSQYSKA